MSWRPTTGDAYAPPDAAAASRVSESPAATRSGDAEGRAFGVIDKQAAATLWLFDKQGAAVAHTPVLVGQATGDVAPA